MRGICVVLVAVSTWLMSAPAHAIPPPADVAAAIEREMASGSYQSDLPAVPEIPDAPRLNIGFPDELIWLARLLLIAGGAIVVFFIGRALIARLRDPPGPRKTKDHPARASVSISATEREAANDPDALAAAGDFPGAIRVLFARALVAAARALSRDAPPSDTGREALRRLDPPQDARAPLSTLARQVEAAVFAGRGANAADYAAARQALAALTSALGGARA